jgi:hypothetical protein
VGLQKDKRFERKAQNPGEYPGFFFLKEIAPGPDPGLAINHCSILDQNLNVIPNPTAIELPEVLPVS